MEKEHLQCKWILSSTWQKEATLARICVKVNVCVLRVCQAHSCGQSRFRHPWESPTGLSCCFYANIFRFDCHVWTRSGQSLALVRLRVYGAVGAAPGPWALRKTSRSGRLLSVTSGAELFNRPQQTLTLNLPQILLEQTPQQQHLNVALVIAVSLSVSFWNIL